ncbi:MAG TPA: helix-turn-helix domain-containing protein [Ramlibacter sp.]|nr:helix-turn-helix domain-containing protein [Ramlibacter sp.]
MIEAVAPLSGAAAPLPIAEDGVSAGTLLRRAREAAGLHVAALAVSLKVPVRKLEALESDRYDLLSDAVFVRALASSVCRNLKIDAQPVLDRLPQGAAPRLIQDSDGLNAPFRGPRDGTGPIWPEQLSKPVILAVFGLLLGALVLILLPRMQASDGGTTPEVKPAEASAPESSAATEPEREAVPQQLAAASPAVASSTVMPGSSPAAAAAPQSAAPAPLSASAAPEAPVPAVAASGIVVFRTKGASWVEVTDAKGVVAYRKLMAAGETGAASGAAPLRVTVGRVDVTEVQVRGKPFDLGTVARDNVARFEVK